MEYASEPVLALSPTAWGRWKRFAVIFSVCCVGSLGIVVKQDVRVESCTLWSVASLVI